MNVQEFYQQIGSDGKKALERFMGKEELALRFLKKMLKDENFKNGKKALEEENYDDLERAAHTLKGICGNLGLDKLYEESSKVVDAIRGGRFQEAASMYQDMEETYRQVVKMIEEL